MTRREGLAVLGAAFLLVIVGMVWLFGPYGLIGSGLALAALVLFGVDVEVGSEAVANAAARAKHRKPIHVQRPG